MTSSWKGQTWLETDGMVNVDKSRDVSLSPNVGVKMFSPTMSDMSGPYVEKSNYKVRARIV